MNKQELIEKAGQPYKRKTEKKLQVWWIPQIPMKPFLVDIETVEQGVKIMNVLADYDIFQHKNRIKPDYCNAGGINMWDDDVGEDGSPGWTSWYDEETGEDDPHAWLQDKTSAV